MRMNKSLEKVAEKFAAVMIGRIMEIDQDWSQPWIPVKRKNFFPQNITGRKYSGSNTLMLLILQMETNYNTPVFLTFKQASERSIRIKKGEHSFPVYHFRYLYVHYDTGEKISEKEYHELYQEEQEDYKRVPSFRYFDVFNLDQTNFSEDYPAQWDSLLRRHREEFTPPDNMGHFSCPVLDDMLERQSWVCPIEVRASNTACYIPSTDKIVLPLKSQFKNGQDFYASALHEMAHSTGAETRLDRLKKIARRSSGYAREELVAELSAALMAYFMGIESVIRDDHASYLKAWIDKLHKEPAFLAYSWD